MKKGLLIYLPADNSWIGGVYYIKNIAYQISVSQLICSKFNIYLLTNSEFIDIYQNLPSNIHILTKNKKCNLFHEFILLLKLLKLNIKYVFPYRIKHSSLFFKKTIKIRRLTNWNTNVAICVKIDIRLFFTVFSVFIIQGSSHSCFGT